MNPMVLKTFILPMLLDFVKNLLFKQIKGEGWIAEFFGKLRALILSSETEVDDLIFLPILDQMETFASVLENEDFVMKFFTELFTEMASMEKPTVWLDTLLEFMERAVKASETTWDDVLFLPLIQLARKNVQLK